jgi:stearoyl-CoA desaturase (delta-9 desaturase)
MGWLFRVYPASDPLRYARDHLRDPGMRMISRLFLPIVGLGLLIPFLLGLAITGTLTGGLTALVWGGFVRLFVGYHTTFAVNSIGHFAGRRRFRTDDESRNVLWLAIPSFGDSFHHNHHAFPTSARHGLRWWELDLSGLAIRALGKVGLAWDVVTVDERAQAQKAA